MSDLNGHDTRITLFYARVVVQLGEPTPHEAYAQEWYSPDDYAPDQRQGLIDRLRQAIAAFLARLWYTVKGRD